MVMNFTCIVRVEDTLLDYSVCMVLYLMYTLHFCSRTLKYVSLYYCALNWHPSILVATVEQGVSFHFMFPLAPYVFEVTYSRRMHAHELLNYVIELID